MESAGTETHTVRAQRDWSVSVDCAAAQQPLHTSLTLRLCAVLCAVSGFSQSLSLYLSLT